MPTFRLPTRRRGATSRRRRDRGQSVVELALVLPVLLLLVLIALDFGRLFLGWIALNNMARVGADFAANHPTANWGTPTDADVIEYRDLIVSNADAINCVLREDPPPGPAEPPPDPVYSGTGEVGEQVRVELNCYFQVITPVVSAVTGTWAKMSASSSYPITFGCLADCPAGEPEPPPPPPDNCRDVPNMRDLSVAGARLEWAAAGFIPSNFNPDTGDDTRTVSTQTITLPPEADTCPSGEVFVGASVTVTLEDLEEPPEPPGCIFVPNMRGMTVADARDVWLDSGLADPADLPGSFTPESDHDDQIVINQLTDPDADPGDCEAGPMSVAVSYGPPPPPPPPAPCQVPSFSNKSSTLAADMWIEALFTGSIDFDKPNQLPYTIQSQSLVGGTWVNCASDILVGPNPNLPGGPG